MTRTQPPIFFPAKHESLREPVRSVPQRSLHRWKTTKPHIEISPQKKTARASGFKHPDRLSQHPSRLDLPFRSQILSAKDSPPPQPR